MSQPGALALLSRRILAPRLAQAMRGGGGGPVPFRGPAKGPVSPRFRVLEAALVPVVS